MMNISRLIPKGISKVVIITISLSLQGWNFQAEARSLSENLINFNSQQGAKLLRNSKAKQDYIPLIINFVTQENLAYCGVASMVMVLNALQISAPVAPEYNTSNVSYPIFTQSNIFNQETDKIITASTISRQGMTLEELGKFLSTYPVKTEVHHAENLNLTQFRQLLLKNMKESDNYVLVNYLRKDIGQERGGHISPVAAYNRKTDRFLILDVARYKYPPIWVKVEELWQAINTVDSTSGKTRGFVSISLDSSGTLKDE